jgi:hypothetical protein
MADALAYVRRQQGQSRQNAEMLMGGSMEALT